jgi:glycosyltransferase involved in cell wall biosynthesis
MWRRRKLSRTSDLEVAVERLTRRADAMETFAADAIAALSAQQRAMEGLAARIGKLELAEQIRTVMSYVRDATIDEKALVSVILATRNRSEYLARAVASVRAQSYPTWELLAVDDGSDDDTYDVLGAMGDTRIRRFRTSHRGLSAARNHALANVAGDYVAYLDDDNTMHPDWLRSIVWAFANWPDCDCLYGAMIIAASTDAEAATRTGMPWLWFVPYDRDRLERENLTDMGAVAHRAGLAEAVFDEELASVEDWDLLLRVARSRDLLALPVVAGTYNTTAPDRLSGPATREAAVRRLRSKHSSSPGARR